VYSLINPIAELATNQAYAKTSTDTEDNVKSDPIGSDSSTAPSIKLTLSDTVKSQEVVKANEIGYISNNFNIEASNVDGYKIFLQAAAGYTSALHGATYGEKISGVGKQVPTSSFGNNQWGYSLNPITSSETTPDPTSLLYSTVPDNSFSNMPAYISISTEETKDFNLTFAAKISDDKPSDHYETQVILSTVAGANITANGFRNISTMQEMTSTICANAEEGDTGRLRDTRDNKMYWVAKMRDGNCWMTQNLDYDGGGEKKNSPSTITPNGTIAQYYDPGYFIDTNPTSRKTCNSNIIATSGFAGCKDYDWIDVTEWEASSDLNFNNIADENAKIYDAHYLIGNYYNYAAATIGSGLTSNSSEAANSICAKGWQLPPAGTESGTFAYLFNTYGITKLISNGPYNILLAPLYFVNGGRLHYQDSYSVPQLQIGSEGCYWTSMGNNKSATYLYFSNDFGMHSYNNYEGGSVRCLVKSS